jgi:phosphonate metabolism protein PhnN/1,5-bisphosphokinase (PRPP-forming)
MLVLVVGPSGAGKDTLMEAAREILGHDDTFRFVRRVVTRPVLPTGEQHESVSVEEFDERYAAGAFALAWQAHGLRYGIPSAIVPDVEDGLVVVANVSRAVVPDAAMRFPVHVVMITASPDILARRLADRGREDAADLARRLSRAITLPLPVNSDTIHNDGTVEDGVAQLVAVLSRLAGGARPI